MDNQQIQQVRRFNRVVAQRVGVLEDNYLRRRRPLGEARLIYETGRLGSDIRTLRARIGLDPGYCTRLLQSLEAQGLVSIEPEPSDGRQRRVKLTSKGWTECASYIDMSDELAETILEPLGEAQRDRLVTAMAEVERLIRASSVEVQVETAKSEDACWCLEEYAKDLAARFEPGFDPAYGEPASPKGLKPPYGYLVVARLDGSPVGCGALKVKNPRLGEIKQMWTAPAVRRLGVARRVLRELEASAKARGLTRLRLETNRALVEAEALYRADGYKEVAAFSDDPTTHHWFEKRL
jgi:DNA-binding MarR family transcriptional regulator/ribosomal protein S18 acetylase RimI-like enzyme